MVQNTVERIQWQMIADRRQVDRSGSSGWGMASTLIPMKLTPCKVFWIPEALSLCSLLTLDVGILLRGRILFDIDQGRHGFYALMFQTSHGRITRLINESMSHPHVKLSRRCRMRFGYSTDGVLLTKCWIEGRYWCGRNLLTIPKRTMR